MSLFALRHILEHIRDNHYDEIDYIIMTGIFLSLFFGIRGNIPEMEFLDISLTKDWSLLLRAIQSPFYRRIWKKTILFSGFINTYKTIRETRKLKSIHG
jgi:hypothetical protein